MVNVAGAIMFFVLMSVGASVDLAKMSKKFGQALSTVIVTAWVILSLACIGLVFV